MAAQLKGAMGNVTSGLKTAFDTTLVALIMAIVLLFPMETLRRIEYRMLDRIEQFTHEALLRRMADDQSAANLERMPQTVRDCLAAAFQQHQVWLAQWQQQVGQLGQAIGADFENAVSRVEAKVSAEEAARNQKLNDISRVINELFQRADATTQTYHPVIGQLPAHLQGLNDATSRLERGIGALAEQLARTAAGEPSPVAIDARLGQQLDALHHQIARLADALDHGGSAAHPDGQHSAERLDVVQPVEPAKRGGFWPWKGRGS
jgi:biopolymer transport protein ExbB/TolQ